MKVLIVSGNFLPLTSSRLSMAPSGAAYILGAAQKSGHTVEVFDGYTAGDAISGLTARLTQFNPDVVGVSITIVTNDTLDKEAEFGTRYFDMRPRIKRIVETVKQASKAAIVLGGGGFNYYGKGWLDYLDLDYGLRGEGENAFPLYLERIEHNGAVPLSVPSVPTVFLKEASTA